MAGPPRSLKPSFRRTVTPRDGRAARLSLGAVLPAAVAAVVMAGGCAQVVKPDPTPARVTAAPSAETDRAIAVGARPANQMLSGEVRDRFQEAIDPQDAARLAEFLDAELDLLRSFGPDMLDAAIRRRSAPAVRLLLDRGVDPNAGLHPPLFKAVTALPWFPDNAPIVRMLLEAGADPKAVDHRDGRTPLHGTGDPAVARLLLDHGADVNAPDRYGRTPVFDIGGRKPNPEVTALLIARGADADHADRHGMTAADYAAAVRIERALWDGDLDALRVALDERPARVNKTPNIMAPLKRGAMYGRDECVRLLIERGADVNEGRGEKTALHMAASHGRPGVARLLLKAGADPNAPDDDGYPPLRHAGNASTVLIIRVPPPQVPFAPPDAAGVRKVLLAASEFRPDARDADGRTVAFDADAETVRGFLAKGGDANVTDRVGTTPLQNAAVSGRFDLTDVLIEHGAQLDVISAAAMGKTVVVRRMIKADLALADRRLKGEFAARTISPLAVAAKYDRREVARLLVEAGVDVNAGYPDHGWMPLQSAVEHDDVELVRLLLARGAKAGIVDAGGGTLLEAAQSEKVRAVLRRAGAP